MAANVNSVNFAGSPGTWVVDPVAGKGQFTTITAAVAAASSGDTIYIRPGTYTENFTIGANIALVGITGGGHTSHEIIVNGKITVSGVFNPVIQNLTLTTNSDYCLSNTSTGRPIIRDCILNASNNAILENTSTGGIYVYDCQIYLLTNTAFLSNTSTGFIRFYGCFTQASTQLTASNTTGIVEIYNSTWNLALSTSSGGTVNAYNSYILSNAAVVNIAYTGTGVSTITNCNLTNSGSQEVATMGAGTRLNITSCTVNSSAANAFTGAGRIDYGGLTFVNTATTSVTTEVYKPLTVKQGGTGVSSQAAYSLVAGGTTTTGAFQAISPVATGQVLTSAGTGALPAFSASPSVTSITLSSGTALSTYIEGSWTPALTIGGSSVGITYSTRTGFYQRIGNFVFISGRIILTSKGGLTGTVGISGLPVTSSATASAVSAPCPSFSGLTFGAGYTQISILFVNSVTTARLAISGTGVAFGDMTTSNTTVGDDFTFYFQGSYPV